MRLPVPMLEFMICTCLLLPMCIPSVLGLSSGAVMVIPLTLTTEDCCMVRCIIGLFLKSKPFKLTFVQFLTTNAYTKTIFVMKLCRNQVGIYCYLNNLMGMGMVSNQIILCKHEK